MPVDFSVTNQLASPAIYASSFATRPAASFKGRLFVDTDNPSTGIYRDTGTAWIAIAGTGVAETQNLESVCQIGNTATTGILITGQSAFGTLSGSPISPSGDYTVTIGETSVENPGNSLFVKYTALFEQNIIVQTKTTTPLLIGGDADTSTLTYRTTSNAGITGARHIFQVGNNGATEAMTILNNANVLIGTTTDAGYKLDVNGTGRFVNGVNMATTSGNVGIGTTSPSFLLDVNGTGRFTGNVTAPDLYAGSGTGAPSVQVFGGASSNSIGGSAYITLQDITNTRFWGLQADASQKLNFWHFNGSWASVANISSTGAATFSSSVYSGISSINASAQLQADSTTLGFLPPRMTTTQKNAIAAPAAGLMVYDTTLNKLAVFTTVWETITSI